MNLIKYCNKIIEYSFYSLFLLVPLVFSGSSSELFEFPKMWLTFGITIIIGAAWITKMILEKRFFIQRTPLDIPLLLFLSSNIISTIFSLDSHVSLWGYYSRFNGGLLSVIAYIFLYYAFVSNLNAKHVLKLLSISLFSGLIVAVWGIPSHFGFDPTCYVFRGSFDTSCWTEAFKPTVRIFSTLGQPAWLAAYMGALLPVSMAFAIQKSQITQSTGKSDSLKLRTSESLSNRAFRVFWKKQTFFILLSLLFYACLTYTDTRGGFIGFWIANILFWTIVIARRTPQAADEAISKNNKRLPHSQFTLSKVEGLAITWKYFLLFNLLFLIFNFLQGVPISQVSKFTLPELSKKMQTTTSSSTHDPVHAGALGGTDSGKIRLLVWKGAIDAWADHPFIGTGVETFAFAYYKYRPVEHNLTSEWDYLYNKAHNEYLNYLTTTGIFGLGSYLLIISVFLFQVFKSLNSNIEARNSKQIQNQKHKNSKSFENLNLENSDLFRISDFGFRILIIGLVAGYISILISNFFGFSVVIINLYFFLIPAFVFILGGFLNPEKSISFSFAHLHKNASSPQSLNPKQWTLLTLLLLVMSYLLFVLINYYRADIAYANGSNLAKGGGVQDAYSFLVKASDLKKNEPVYADELSLNLGTIASALYLQKEASTASELTKEAIATNDNVVNAHPNNIVFWKNRVRLFYTLAQGDAANEKSYLEQAHQSISKAQALAPTDAKVSYNLGVLVGQTGDLKKAIEILEQTVVLKPDYRDAYFAMGLFYDEIGNREKATQNYEYILKNIDPNDKQVKETLESWKQQ